MMIIAGLLDMSNERQTFWERLVLAAAATILATAVIGVWRSVQSMSETQAVIQSQLQDVRAAVQGIYTQRDADKDFAAVFRTDKDQYQRLDDHEERLRALEARKR